MKPKNTGELKDDLAREAEELRQRKPPSGYQKSDAPSQEELVCHGDVHVFSARYKPHKNLRCICFSVTWEEYFG